MDVTLALAESMIVGPRRKRVTSKIDPSVPVETPTDRFFNDSPLSPTKPLLPDELTRFAYLHRMAATGGMPADKAQEVIDTIHAVADGKRSGLMFEARMEELQELNDWLMQWIPADFEPGDDPYANE